MSELLPVEDALSAILADVKVLEKTESVPLIAALGRVLATSVSAAVDVPPWDSSAMDGYAVRAADVELGVALPVSQRIAAGQVGKPLQLGTAARIFTGAPVPSNADAIVMQEDTQPDGELILCTEFPKVGNHIRSKGQDITSGATVLSKGRVLNAADLGVIASVGVASVTVVKRPLVAILSTGDELTEPGEDLAEGAIYNSNRYMLHGLLTQLGCEVLDLGIVEDTLEATQAWLAKAANSADLIITTGGVSVGEEDYVKAAVEAQGQLALWKLAIKPGKPLAYGRVVGVPILGLPGNPSSVFVTFTIVAAAYIRAMVGCDPLKPLTIKAKAQFDWPKPGARAEYLRANVVTNEMGELVCQRFANQSSGVLSSASQSKAFALIPIGATFKVGDAVDVLLINELLQLG